MKPYCRKDEPVKGGPSLSKGGNWKKDCHCHDKNHRKIGTWWEDFSDNGVDRGHLKQKVKKEIEKEISMKTRELAEKFMDELLYDGDFINRWEPFDEKKHYADWLNKFGPLLEELTEELGWDFFNEDFIEMFTCGDYDEMMEAIEIHPCLQPLYDLLDEYHEWLCELE